MGLCRVRMLGRGIEMSLGHSTPYRLGERPSTAPKSLGNEALRGEAHGREGHFFKGAPQRPSCVMRRLILAS